MRDGPGTSDQSELAAQAAALLRLRELLVDDRPLDVRPGLSELRDVIVPLLLWCGARAPRGRRGLVGIAGPPGAGKSVLTAMLAATAKALGFAGYAFLALDGYHLPSDVLDRRAGRDPDGNVVPLRALKGAPESFDAERLLEDLRGLRSGAAERFLPKYSRVLHDPVPRAIRVGPEAKWVFVEGNFLFLDVAPWRQVRELLDRKVYVDASDEVLRDRLARRHGAAGRTREWIEAHFRRTDGPNIERARAGRRFADAVCEWRADGWHPAPGGQRGSQARDTDDGQIEA